MIARVCSAARSQKATQHSTAWSSTRAPSTQAKSRKSTPCAKQPRAASEKSARTSSPPATGHLHLGATEDAVDFAVGAVVNEASVTGWVVVELKGCTRQTAQIRVINVYDGKDAAHEDMHHLRTAAHQRDPTPPPDDDTFKM